MRVLAVDPGTATGFALWDDGVFSAWEKTGLMDAGECVWRYVDFADEVVCERFNLSLGGRAMTPAGIRDTLELTGVVKYACGLDGPPLHFQDPAESRFSTNQMLKDVGFHTPSKPDHMRSAARHLLLRLVKNGTIDGISLIR